MNRIEDSADDGIDLIALWRVVWQRKLVIAVSSLVCGLVAAFLAIRAVPTYRAETVISEVREQSVGGGLMSQLGGLASLAGVGLGGAKGSEAQAVLKSRRLSEEFIQRNDMLSELGAGLATKPSLWLAVKRLKERMITIREDKLSGLTTISLDGPDPAVTAMRLNAFVALANELIRARAINSAKQNLVYLNEQVARTSEVELRRVLFDLIGSETKTLMLANVRAEYAFTVVDPAVAPDVRISPQRSLMIVIGLLVGAILGTGIAFALQNVRMTPRPAAV